MFKYKYEFKSFNLIITSEQCELLNNDNANNNTEHL